MFGALSGSRDSDEIGTGLGRRFPAQKLSKTRPLQENSTQNVHCQKNVIVNNEKEIMTKYNYKTEPTSQTVETIQQENASNHGKYRKRTEKQSKRSVCWTQVRI